MSGLQRSGRDLTGGGWWGRPATRRGGPISVRGWSVGCSGAVRMGICRLCELWVELVEDGWCEECLPERMDVPLFEVGEE